MRRIPLLLLALVALAAGSARAQGAAEPKPDPGDGQPFDITARSFEFDTARSLYIGEGDVRVVQGDRVLEADWLTFNSVTREGVASGNVVLHEGTDTLYGEFLQFEIDDLRGIVYDGELQSEVTRFRVTGREMRKTGRNTYEIEDGVYTTCDCPDPEDPLPWQIRAEHTDIEFGGYATARNNKLDVLGVPVFWLPWFRWPVRTDRTTGFLLPTFNASARSGGDIGVPFFWAAADPLNVIVKPSFLFERGAKVDVDFEYVIDEYSWGDLHTAFVPDDWDVDDDDVIDPFRWAVRFEHDHWLPFEWRGKIDLNVVSDNQYPFDFKDMDEFRRDRFIESRAFVGRWLDEDRRFHLVGGIWWADDIQNPDDQDRDAFLLQRMPDVQLTGRTERLEIYDRAIRAFDVQYTYFWQRERAASVYPDARVVGDDIFLDTGIDAIPNGEERNVRGDVVRLDGSIERTDGSVVTAADLLEQAELAGTTIDPLLLSVDGSRDDFPPGPEGNGRFDEGEPLADRGHRLLLNPRVGRPFWVWNDRLELYPEVGLHQTFYQTDGQSFANRTLLSARFDARTRLRREFELPLGQGTGIHYLEPSFTYMFLSKTSQRENPLFMPGSAVPQERVRHSFLDNILRDPSDRIDGFHGFQLAVHNRIMTWYQAPESEEPPVLRLWADLAVFTTFDFLGRDLGNFYVDGTFYPRPDLEAQLVLGYDYENTELSEALMQVRWKHELGHEVFVRWRFLEEIPRFFEDFQFSDDRFDEFETGFTRVNQFDFGVRYAITRNWAVTYDTRYSFEESLFLDNAVGVEYISKCACWAIRAELDDDRSSGVEFNFQYKLLGLGGDDDNVIRPF